MVSLRIQPSNSNDTAGLSCLMGSFPLYYNCDFQLNNSRVFLDPLRWKNVLNLLCVFFFFFLFFFSCSLLTGDQEKKKFPSQVNQGSPSSFFFFPPVPFPKEKGALSRLLKEACMFLGMNWEPGHKIKWRGISAETTFRSVILWKNLPQSGEGWTSLLHLEPEQKNLWLEECRK